MNDVEKTEREIEKLNKEIENCRKKAKSYADQEKAILANMKSLNRKERTHRLCTIGGLLEKYLQRPQDFTVDEVQNFLNYVFSLQAVQFTLKKFLEKKSLEFSDNEET